MSLKQRVTLEFRKRFGSAPQFVVRAPGRVNLIGEHTDYNDGFVLPMPIDRAVWIAGRSRRDRRVVVHSLDKRSSADFGLHALAHDRRRWVEYLKGVVWALERAGHALRGWEGVLAGDVPIGAGLASSAALEMAAARAFSVTSEFPWRPKEMAQIAQRAESEWVGMRCGIMDQLIAAAGVAGHALLVDCRSLELEPLPLPADTLVAVLDTATRRGLVDSVYNERRAQCEAAARALGVTALRDASLELLRERGSQLETVAKRRAYHVVNENARTLQAADALRQGDPARLGELMNASHASLRDDFEVSSAELNAMVECAQREQACFGARLTGAGLGGCAVALVRAAAAYEFAAAVAACYEEATGLWPNVYVCKATGGAQVVS